MTFYADAALPFQAAYKAWVASVVGGFFPDDVTASTPNTGDILDDATGDIVGTWTEGSSGSTTGGNAGAWAAGVGARSLWHTSARRSNRRVTGTTFIVPMAAVVFDLNGQPSSAFVSSLNGFNTTLLSALGTAGRVWSRPNNSLRNNGSSHQIISASVPVKTSWLSTRRT